MTARIKKGISILLFLLDKKLYLQVVYLSDKATGIPDKTKEK